MQFQKKFHEVQLHAKTISFLCELWLTHFRLNKLLYFFFYGAIK